MQLTTRGRYAVMAMVELAARAAAEPELPVSLAEVAAAQQLSLCYLEQLFVGLRRAGLVISARGPHGGYRLARPAARVSVADVLAAVDEPLDVTRCASGAPGCLADTVGSPARCRTHELWEALGQHVRLFVRSVTLADVLAGDVRGVAQPLRIREPAE
jgi:Rrf2 family iron-sulfur cluster assembly transcriptional regulator